MLVHFLDGTSAEVELRPYAYLRGADLAGVSLSGANLRYADLAESDLTGADFSNADLHGANLSGAITTDTVFTNTVLTGVIRGSVASAVAADGSISLQSSESANARLTLTSYQSTDSVGGCELIRMLAVKRTGATLNDTKSAIAYYVTDSPSITPGDADVWLQTHYALEAEGGVGGNNLHQHWSVETSNAARTEVNSRLSVPWGVDVAEIQTFSSNFHVRDGLLGLNCSSLSNGDLCWNGPPSSNISPDGTHRRWTARKNATAESGSDVGSDWALHRHADNGAINTTPVIFAKRSNGLVGIGTASPTASLDVVSSTNGNIRASRGAVTSFASIILATTTTDVWSARMSTTAVAGAGNENDWHFRNVADGVTAMVLQKRATQANVTFLGATAAYGNGVGVLRIETATTPPNAAPSTGAFAWIQSGTLKLWFAGAGAAVTVIAA